MALKEGPDTVYPPFVKARVTYWLRKGSLPLEVVSDGIRCDTAGGGERHIRIYRKERRKTSLGWEELSPQMAGFRDTGRQWEGNVMPRFG